MSDVIKILVCYVIFEQTAAVVGVSPDGRFIYPMLPWDKSINNSDFYWWFSSVIYGIGFQTGITLHPCIHSL